MAKKRGKRSKRNAASRAAAALNRARGKALTGKRRSEIAREAAMTRWLAWRAQEERKAQEAPAPPMEDHDDGI